VAAGSLRPRKTGGRSGTAARSLRRAVGPVEQRRVDRHVFGAGAAAASRESGRRMPLNRGERIGSIGGHTHTRFDRRTAVHAAHDATLCAPASKRGEGGTLTRIGRSHASAMRSASVCGAFVSRLLLRGCVPSSTSPISCGSRSARRRSGPAPLRLALGRLDHQVPATGKETSADGTVVDDAFAILHFDAGGRLKGRQSMMHSCATRPFCPV